MWTIAVDGIHIDDGGGTKLGFIATPATPSNCCFGFLDDTRFFIVGQKHIWALDLSGEG